MPSSGVWALLVVESFGAGECQERREAVEVGVASGRIPAEVFRGSGSNPATVRMARSRLVAEKTERTRCVRDSE